MKPEQRETAEKALSTIEHLYPSLPVLSKLTSLLKDMNIDQGDIANLVKTDASLTSDIIRISNSPYYGSSTKCSDITNALLIIGQDRVLKVVSLCISRNLFNQDLAHYGIPAEDYWASSIAAGLLMENLSGPTGIDRDQAYTLGILHSVGMTIINRILDNLKIEMYWDNFIPQVEWEEQITGYNFAYAGAEVLKRWKFPDEFTDIIRFQVHPENASQQSQILNCLHFVGRLLEKTGWKLQMYENVELDAGSREFLKANQLDETYLAGMLAQTQDQMHRIMKLF